MKNWKALVVASIAIALGGAATASKAQENQFKDLQPTGLAHRVALSAASRTKIELAYEAVLDVSDLAGGDEYLPENLDARRALRAATVAANSKDAKSLVNDIEMIRLIKETCRAMNTSADFRDCFAVETMWVNRVRIELGKPPLKKD
jgi:hypothetical protein